MEDNTEINPRRILQIEIEPLLWEILKAVGSKDIHNLSPHQQAKKYLLERMQQVGLYPKRTWGDSLGEILALLLENGMENNRIQQEIADNLKKNNFEAEPK